MFVNDVSGTIPTNADKSLTSLDYSARWHVKESEYVRTVQNPDDLVRHHIRAPEARHGHVIQDLAHVDQEHMTQRVEEDGDAAQLGGLHKPVFLDC